MWRCFRRYRTSREPLRTERTRLWSILIVRPISQRFADGSPGRRDARVFSLGTGVVAVGIAVAYASAPNTIWRTARIASTSAVSGSRRPAQRSPRRRSRSDLRSSDPGRRAGRSTCTDTGPGRCPAPRDCRWSGRARPTRRPAGLYRCVRRSPSSASRSGCRARRGRGGTSRVLLERRGRLVAIKVIDGVVTNIP